MKDIEKFIIYAEMILYVFVPGIKEVEEPLTKFFRECEKNGYLSDWFVYVYNSTNQLILYLTKDGDTAHLKYKFHDGKYSTRRIMVADTIHQQKRIDANDAYERAMSGI